jgi:putative (di)nucleoside polyphosphate hydrolase
MNKIYRQAVMAVIVNRENKILIGYSPRDKSYKFPQGGLEDGEDIIPGIQRELMEELNYTLYNEFILEVYSEKIKYPFPPNCHPVFKGQELSIVKIKHNPEAQTVPQDDEFNKLYWIKPVDISNYNTEYRSEAYFRALEICGLL